MGEGRGLAVLVGAVFSAGLSAPWAEGPAVAFSAQAPGVPGSPDKWVQLTNVDGGPYERRFGAPIMMSACTLLDEVSVPSQRSIRTFGRFDPGHPASWRHPEAAPGSTATARPLCDTPGQTGPSRSWRISRSPTAGPRACGPWSPPSR